MQPTSPRIHPGRALTFLPIAAALLATGGLAAQTVEDSARWADPNPPFARITGHSVVVGGESGTGTTAAPVKHGPAGAQLLLVTEGLPRDRAAQISFGAMQGGFEVIATSRTDGAGRFGGRDTVTVTIPEWAKHDRPYLLIVSDLEYRPFAPSEMVHPTDARGMVLRRGVVKRDSTCPTLTGTAEELYFLTGRMDGLETGDEVELEGRILQDAECGPGSTIVVESWDRIVPR